LSAFWKHYLVQVISTSLHGSFEDICDELSSLMMMMMVFWRRVVSNVDGNVSDKHAVSIFGAKVTKLGSRGFLYV
jgi:hypothetical protein